MRKIKGWPIFFLLSTLVLVAWQPEPPLLLEVSADPAAPSRGGSLILVFAVQNIGSEPLEGVVVRTSVPAGTSLEEAGAEVEGWAATVLEGGEVWLTAGVPLSPGESASLVMQLAVSTDAADVIVVDGYSAFARGLSEAVAGAPLTLGVDVTPVPTTPPEPSSTPTSSPTATQPAPVATETPSPTPSSVASPSPTPSPTITVVMVPLVPTATPVLSSEQEQLGTLTVSIFVGIALLIAIAATIWLVRWSRRT
jgi:uncharacterized repeat protein (TIGR01451 family)